MQVRRTLPAGVDSQLAVDFTRPVFLVKLLFPTGATFVSTGPQITFEGNVYQEGQVYVGSFRWNPDGSQQGNITLSNENNAASALILGGTINDIEIVIYKTYLIAGGGNTTPSVYVRGSMDGSEVGYDRVDIGVLSTSAQTGTIPNRYYTTNEGFNFLPIEGEKITWGEEVFILQEARR